MDLDQLQNRASESLKEGKFEDAITLYEQCIAGSLNFIVNYWDLGLALLLQGDSFQAQGVWLSAFTISGMEEQELSRFLEHLKSRGNDYLTSGHSDFAAQIFETLLEWDETQPDIYYQFGHAVALQGNLDQAIELWQRVIELQPNRVEVYLDQGEILQKLEQFESAIKCYQKAIELEPNFLSYYQFGLCLTQLKKWQDASRYFEASLQFRPDFAPAYSDLGFAFLQIGQLDSAIQTIKSAIQLQPHFSDVLIKDDQSNSIKNSALNFIDLLSNQNSSSGLIYLTLGQLLSSVNPQFAITAFQKVLKINSQSATACLEIGKILLQRNQLNEAITHYHKANHLEPNNPLIAVEFGKALLKAGRLEDAIALFKTAIHLNPNFTEAYQLLGQTELQIRNWEAAILAFKKQLKIGQNSPLSLAYLAFCLAQMGLEEEAIASFQNSLKTAPEIAPIVDQYIKTLCQQGKLNPHHPKLDLIQCVDPPKKFYLLALDWISQNNIPLDYYHQIYPEITIPLTIPKTLDSTIHFSFRFGKQLTLPPSFVVQIYEGRFWLSSNQTQTAIITPNHHFIAEISPDYPILSPGHPDKHPSKHGILSLEKLPPVHQLQGTAVVLAGLSNNVYFHWMLDVLPRLELLKKSRIDQREIDYYIMCDRLPFQQETLTYLDIPKPKIINPEVYPHLQATQLIVPSFPGHIAWMPKWTCEFLRHHFLKSNDASSSDTPKRIYITRKNAKTRRLLNEAEIINILQEYGFEEIQLESRSVLDQAKLFAQAEVIIAPHGSGLTNLIFCQPNTTVIELFSPNYVYHCYWWISNLMNLNYYYLLGETLPGFHLHHLIYPRNFAEDIFINPNNLVNLIKLAISS